MAVTLHLSTVAVKVNINAWVSFLLDFYVYINFPCSNYATDSI